jgi:hypothetical protein
MNLAGHSNQQIKHFKGVSEFREALLILKLQYLIKILFLRS